VHQRREGDQHRRRLARSDRPAMAGTAPVRPTARARHDRPEFSIE